MKQKFESPVPETIAISSSSWPGETPADTRRVDEVAVFDSEFLRPRNDSTSRLAVDITAYTLQRDQMKIINTEQTKTELSVNASVYIRRSLFTTFLLSHDLKTYIKSEYVDILLSSDMKASGIGIISSIAQNRNNRPLKFEMNRNSITSIFAIEMKVIAEKKLKIMGELQLPKDSNRTR
uniref:Uncharacterized protein n=1 Tax=Glossina austeni TaxID=7395 RepID=A0A1A9VCE4_GLOAU